MPIVNQFSADYPTSRDYRLLAILMRASSLVCMVDNLPHPGSSDSRVLRDVARTLFTHNEVGLTVFQISARGIGYLHADSEDDFIHQCGRLNVEFIPPAVACGQTVLWRDLAPGEPLQAGDRLINHTGTWATWRKEDEARSVMVSGTTFPCQRRVIGAHPPA